MGTGRRISDRLTENQFVRNVIGPRVLEPVTTWYETNLRDRAPGDTDGRPTTESPAADPAVAEPAVAEPAATEPTVAGPSVDEPVAPGDAHDRADRPADVIDLTVDADPASPDEAAVVAGAAVAAAASGAATTTAERSGSSRSLESARAAERFLGVADEGHASTVTVAPRPESSSEQAVPFAAAPSATIPEAPTAPTTSSADTASGSADTASPSDDDVHPSDPDDAAPVATPAKGGFAGVKDIAMRLKARVKHHNLNVVAAGIAFWGLLAIPAILTATISIYGLVASPDDVERQIEDLASGMSEEGRAVITDQLSAVTSSSGGGLAVGAVIGIVLALWSSSGAVAKMINTMNLIWEVREDRKFFELRGVAIAITLGSILFFLSTAFLLAVVPALLDSAGLGEAARWVIGIARFPAMLLFMMVGLAFLYWFGPNRDSTWRFVTWGAFVGTVGWLVVSGLFSVYTTYFASYNETYAGIGGVVILLLWLFVTAFMVLVGAEIDAAREERDEELAALGRS